MSLRKKIAIAAVMVVVFSLAAYGTLAYLVGNPGTAHNVITSGNVTIDLRDGYPANVKVMPGTRYERAVTVAPADGSADCWVRVRFSQTLRDAGGEVRDESSYADKILLDFNTREWVYSGGWYYWPEILSRGDETGNLLRSIVFDGPGIGNEYQNGEYTITFEAQAVQSDNNDPAGGVLSVAGWPAN